MFQHAGALHPGRLTADQIDIEDIVHGLGAIKRFNGQTRVPLPVLWHSLMVWALCRETTRQEQIEALFHDAAEAYVGDWIRPLKSVLGEELKSLRSRIQETCFAAALVVEVS